MSPSKYTGGSIPITEHRRRLKEKKEKYGEDTSRAMLFQTMHTKKLDGTYVCRKSQEIIDTVTRLQQTHPKVSDASMWLEATSGVKKEGYVFGFRSYTQHYFTEAMRQKAKLGESSSHRSCEERLRRLQEDSRELRAEFKRVEAAFARVHRGWIAFSGPNAHTRRNQASGIGLDDINNTNEGTGSSSDVDDTNNEV